MANQSPHRREILKMLSLAAAASQFPGFTRWAYAHSPSAEPRPSHYSPQFFSPAEYITIEQLTDLIIPNDGTPGAKDAGVSEFIDFMAASDQEIQQPLRSGLQWLDAHSIKSHGSAFDKLAPDQQTSMLHYTREQAAGHEFFSLIRRYTVMGYYTSRIGLEQLDFPGLRSYSKSPECPHTDDPEHLHLPPPRF